MAGVAHFIFVDEQTRLNPVCYFPFLDIFLASNGFNYSELINVLKCTYHLRLSYVAMVTVQ